MITPEPADRSSPTTIQIHPEDRCASLLANALESQGIAYLELPGGRQALVLCPESQQALKAAFSDATLIQELRQGLSDVQDGRVRRFRAGERPTPPLT